MKLKESDFYTKLCNINDENFYDDWNENIKEYSLDLPFFYKNLDVLLYIKESELVYKKKDETMSGSGHRKCVKYKDIYCFKLNNNLYIYIYIIFVREQDMSSSYTMYNIDFDHFTENYK